MEKSTSKSCYSTHLVAVWGCRLSYGTMDSFSDLMGSSSLLCLSKHPSPGRFYRWPTSSGRAFPGKAGNMWLKFVVKGFGVGAAIIVRTGSLDGSEAESIRKIMTLVKTLDDPFGLTMVTEHRWASRILLVWQMDTAKPVPSDQIPLILK